MSARRGNRADQYRRGRCDSGETRVGHVHELRAHSRGDGAVQCVPGAVGRPRDHGDRSSPEPGQRHDRRPRRSPGTDHHHRATGQVLDSGVAQCTHDSVHVRAVGTPARRGAHQGVRRAGQNGPRGALGRVRQRRNLARHGDRHTDPFGTETVEKTGQLLTGAVDALVGPVGEAERAIRSTVQHRRLRVFDRTAQHGGAHVSGRCRGSHPRPW